MHKAAGTIHRRLCLIAGFALVGVAFQAAAQTYPSKPITMIWPFTPGSLTERAAREILNEASRLLGQPIVLENRSGANSRLGLAAQRSAPPDGYMLSVAIDGLLVSQPLADPAFRLDAGKDYAPIALLYHSPLALVGPPTLPFRDLKGLIAYAKANPGKLNFAMATASTTHFVTERFRQAAGIDFTMIPYKGTSQALIDLMSGRVDLAFNSGVKPQVESGKLIALATTGSQRWHILPATPTLTEQGVPLASSVWFAVIAHPQTPKDIVGKLNSAFNAAKNPQVARNIEELGWKTYPASSPEEMASYVRAEIEAWTPVIRKAGIKLE